MATNADRIIGMLRDAGVSRLFGMPGGGSPADLIAAAGRAGFPFTLAHAETAAAFMAAAQAEITGRPGACVATLGPGAASLINGVSHAFLDRVPLLAITDHHATAGSEHQMLPHSAMFAPIVKSTGRISTRRSTRWPRRRQARCISTFRLRWRARLRARRGFRRRRLPVAAR
jgi:acetolactate synthase-1/2/3 large subunit